MPVEVVGGETEEEEEEVLEEDCEADCRVGIATGTHICICWLICIILSISSEDIFFICSAAIFAISGA